MSDYSPFFCMKDLKDYIATDKTFVKGIALLQKYAIATVWLKPLQTMGDSAYSRSIILREIKAYLASTTQPEIATHKLQRSDVLASEDPTAHPEIKAIVEERKQLFKNANRLHFELVLAAERILQSDSPQQEDLSDKVFELRKVILETDKRFDITNHYDQTGEILKPSPIQQISLKNGEGLERRLRTLKTYLAPSYLKKIPTDRQATFIQNTKAEILLVESALIEQSDTYNYFNV